MKYEKEIRAFIGDSAVLDKGGAGIIFGVKDGTLQHIADVRGWGAIQNLFKFESDASEFQDEMGKFIADAITEKLNKPTKK